MLILFTMTTGLRDRLHSKIEKQFHDRIRRDGRFVLHYVEQGEMLALYRKRLDRWIGPGEAELRASLQASGEPHLPFTAARAIQLTEQKSLRDGLRALDEKFREELSRVTTDVPYDYLIWKRELRAKLSGDAFEDTKGHLETVQTLLNNLGEALAGECGMVLEQVVRQDQDGLEVLLLRFHDPADSSRWVRVYLCRLTFVFNQKLRKALDLLANRNRKKNFLWVVRAAPIPPDSLAERPGQAFAHLLLPETEVALKAMISVQDSQQEYEQRDARNNTTHWCDGLRFLAKDFAQTHVGNLFAHARQAIEHLAPAEADTDAEPPLFAANQQPNAAEQLP